MENARPSGLPGLRAVAAFPLALTLAFAACDGGGTGPAAERPSPPAGPAAAEVGADRVTISWVDASDDEDGFRVERRVGAAAFTVAGQTGPDVTTFTDTDVEPATSYGYRVSACNAAGCSEPTAEITVTTDPAPPVIVTSSLPEGEIGVPYEAALEAEGGDGAYAWSLDAGELPDGVSLSPGGVLEGTPGEGGTFGFTVRVESAGLATTAELELPVADPVNGPTVATGALPDAGVGAPYSAELEASGGNGDYVWMLEGGAPAGLSMAPDGTLAGTPAEAGDFVVTVRVASAGLEDAAELDLTVHPALIVATTGLPVAVEGQAYEAFLATGGGDGSTAAWSLTAGSLPDGISLDPDGRLHGTPTAAGTAAFTVRVENGLGQSGERELELRVNAALGVSTSSLPGARVGEAYSVQLAATGGGGSGYAWSVADGALPPGLELSPGGLLSGTPTDAGTFGFTVRVESSDGQEATRDLSLSVAPRGLHLERIVQLPSAGVFLTSPPGDDRLFVVEQVGRIWIVEDGALLPEPFLDLRDRVVSGGERGLLGLAFHPSYASNGRFFVDYTGAGGDTRVERYTVGGDPDVADPGSAVLVLEVDQPFSNHNGGMIAFGPDGMLYIGMGDGGSGGDPLGHGQDTSTLLGALLRLDVDGGSPYAIPDGNPFDGTDGREEIWAYGLRNPWRWSFDPVLGALIIADVGQNQREEVNVQPAGAAGLNYGWSVMEGSSCFGGGGACSEDGLELPDYEYTHTAGACSVTGGYVYRGSLAPSLVGDYVFSDFCAGWFRALEISGTSVTGSRTLDLPDVGNVLSFGVDDAGELYVLTADGSVWRFQEG